MRRGISPEGPGQAGQPEWDSVFTSEGREGVVGIPLIFLGGSLCDVRSKVRPTVKGACLPLDCEAKGRAAAGASGSTC